MAHAQSRACPDGARCGPGGTGAAGRPEGVPARVAGRAWIVLLAAEGLTGAEIAERAGCTEPTRDQVAAAVRRARAGEPGGRAARRRPGDGADRAGRVRDPGRDRDPAAGITAQAGGHALVVKAAGGLAWPQQEDPGQPRFHHPGVAPVLPAAPPQRGIGLPRVRLMRRWFEWTGPPTSRIPPARRSPRTGRCWAKRGRARLRIVTTPCSPITCILRVTRSSASTTSQTPIPRR
jgi:hypothetical protein